MSLKKNALLASLALDAARQAAHAYCNAVGIPINQLSEKLFDRFTNLALIEAFHPDTKMREIWKDANVGTIGDLKKRLEADAIGFPRDKVRNYLT
jgi:hypothetical protein